MFLLRFIKIFQFKIGLFEFLGNFRPKSDLNEQFALNKSSLLLKTQKQNTRT